MTFLRKYLLAGGIAAVLFGAVLFGAVLFAPALFAPMYAAAQDEDPGEERAETFEAAAEGAQTENIPGGMLMVTAYGVVFALVLGYVFSIGFRQTATARDLERLRRDIESADTSDRA